MEPFALLSPFLSCWRRGFGDRGKGELRRLEKPSGEERKRGRPKEGVVDFGLRLKEILGSCC